jgi:hypothetical protein
MVRVIEAQLETQMALLKVELVVVLEGQFYYFFKVFC